MKSQTDAADETVVAVRNGKCYLRNLRVFQRTTDAPKLYLQLFNNYAPTLGTTAPNMVIEIPAGQVNDDSAVLDLAFKGKRGGLYFDTALSYAVTTTHDGLTGPDAGDEPQVFLDYENLG